MKKILILLFLISIGFSQSGTDHAGNFFSNWWDQSLMLPDTTLAPGAEYRIQDGRGFRTNILVDTTKTGFTDGTDSYYLKVVSGKLQILNDAGTPLVKFEFDSLGNLILYGALILDASTDFKFTVFSDTLCSVFGTDTIRQHPTR